MRKIVKCAAYLTLLQLALIDTIQAQEKLTIDPLHYKEVIKGDRNAIGTWGDGKLYLLDLWGTWCAPCIKNIPELSKLQDKYAEKLLIIGYSWEGRERLKPFVEKMGDKIRYLIVSDPDEVTIKHLSEDRELVEGFPYAFLIDEDGHVIWRGDPKNGLEEYLEDLFSG